MMDWTFWPNENNLLHISIYSSLSLAELCITAPWYTKDWETFSPAVTPRARPRGANFFCCATQYSKRRRCLFCSKASSCLTRWLRASAPCSESWWCIVEVLQFCLQTSPPALYLVCRLLCAASTQSPWTLLREGPAGPLVVVALRV